MKSLKRIFAIVLVVSILLSSVVCINVSASESTYKEHISCVNEHFAWVQDEDNIAPATEERFPENDVGNCPYVAMSLLLSYYDAYWDDGFIPNTYEFETTGIINTANGEIIEDFHFELENEEWADWLDFRGLDSDSAEARASYGEFVEEYGDDYFNLYLISLSMERNLGVLDALNMYGMTGSMMKNFLEYYLYDICGYTEEQIVVHKESAVFPDGRYGMFNKAAELISNGTPVLYCGLEETSFNPFDDEPISGHVLLGYKVDGTDIVLSPCWNNYEKQMMSTTEFEYMSSIIWFEINAEAFPHVCSDSYADANDPNRKLCTCEIYRNHPNHMDSINTGEEVCPSAVNTAICLCGEVINNTHRYYIRHYNDIEHWFECPCGALTPREIHYIQYNEVTRWTHSGYCNCGYIFLDQSHSYKNYVKTSASYHTGTCDCGQTGSESHMMQEFGLGIQKCMKCNYTKKITDGNENVHLGIEDGTESEAE